MITSGVALSMLLQACSLTPKYERPALPAETSAWPQGEAYGESPKQGMAAADIGWQSFFQDPALKKLIAVALDSNRDLRVRSEEHTSELQSLMRISYAVFCLKKNKHN